MWARTGGTINLRCECEETRNRPMTDSERKRYAASDKRGWDRCKRMHAVSHDFKKQFKDKEGRQWKWVGWELTERVTRWSKKYPKDVIICGVDDSYHASSDMVLILHRESLRKNWGTTVVVIPQCDGQPPMEFFMYPAHRKGIQEALTRISKVERS